MTMLYSTATFRTNNSVTDLFEANVGLKEKKSAGTSFVPALEQVIRKLSVGRKGTLLYKSCQFLAYVNDINIMAQSFISAKETSINLDKIANEVGLLINKNKPQMMMQTRNTKERQKKKQLTSSIWKKYN